MSLLATFKGGRAFFILISAILTFTVSCVNTKRTGLVWIRRGQHLYKAGNYGDVYQGNYKPDTIEVVLPKGKAALLAPKPDGSLTPNPIQFADLSVDSTVGPVNPSEAANCKALQNSVYFFPNDSYSASNPPKRSGGARTSQPMHYIDIRPAWQALTIPIRYRPSLPGGIASNADAAVTLGPSFGFKFTNYSFRRLYLVSKGKDGSFGTLSDHTAQWALTPGIFVAPTVIALDSLHTDGKILTSRNTIGTTYGAFCVFGYNDFNLGVAIGIDNTYGTGPDAWWYNGKPWIGVVFSIDFFK